MEGEGRRIVFAVVRGGEEGRQAEIGRQEASRGLTNWRGQHQRLQAEVDSLQDERNALRLSLARREDACASGGLAVCHSEARIAGANANPPVGGAHVALLEDVSGKVMLLMDQMGEIPFIVMGLAPGDTGSRTHPLGWTALPLFANCLVRLARLRVRIFPARQLSLVLCAREGAVFVPLLLLF